MAVHNYINNITGSVGDLPDVDLTGIANGEGLAWNTNKFEKVVLAGPDTNITTGNLLFTDSITHDLAGNHLTFNGMTAHGIHFNSATSGIQNDVTFYDNSTAVMQFGIKNATSAFIQMLNSRDFIVDTSSSNASGSTKFKVLNNGYINIGVIPVDDTTPNPVLLTRNATGDIQKVLASTVGTEKNITTDNLLFTNSRTHDLAGNHLIFNGMTSHSVHFNSATSGIQNDIAFYDNGVAAFQTGILNATTAFIHTLNGKRLAFGSNAGQVSVIEQMSLHNTGNLSIGTNTDDTNRLHVVGDTNTDGVYKVSGTQVVSTQGAALTAVDATVVIGGGAAVLTTADKNLIDNMRIRINELESRLQAHGLIL